MRYALKPWLIVLVVYGLYAGIILARHNGDPLAFARIGTTDCYGDDEGYDGQFTYFIARDPNPATVTALLDVPAYRYQRILLPILARLLAFGQAGLIPWTILLINIAAQTAATAAVEKLLAALDVSRWYALVYGLWAGFLVSVRTDIAEPLAYGLIAAAYLADRQGRVWLATFCFGLALFAKETTLLFLFAQLACSLFNREGRRLLSLFVLAALPFAIWQVVLQRLFGSFGLGSGGCKGTPFEVIPFMGVWRILPINATVFVVFLLFLGPWFMFPAVWGIIASAREVLRRDWHPYVWALGANAAIVPFTPLSTFREPAAMIRFICGLVLATLLFGGLIKSKRVLNYSWFWLAMAVFLIRD
jgi:hypothetical protein